VKKLPLIYSFVCLFLAASISSFILKRSKIFDVEKGLKTQKLQFGKTQEDGIVELLGKNYDFATSSKHAKMAGGDDWYWSYHHYTYPENGIGLVLTKFNSNKSHTLSDIKLSTPYPHLIMGFIKLGGTPFDSLSKRLGVDEFGFEIDQNDSIVFVNKRYTNYNFITKLHTMLPDSLSEMEALKLIDSLSRNSTVDSVEIRRPRKL
jgi:hypothetical protein